MKKKSTVLIVILVILLSLTTACSGQNQAIDQVLLNQDPDPSLDQNLTELNRSFRERINHVWISLYRNNGSGYYDEAWIGIDRIIALEILNPEPGAYHLEIQAEECVDAGFCIKRFYDKQEIVIKPGENKISAHLKLYDRQGIKVDLEGSGIDLNNLGTIQTTARRHDGAVDGLAYALSSDKTEFFIYIPLDATEVYIYIGGQQYTITAEGIVGAMIENVPLLLDNPQQPNTFQATISFGEGHINVPADYSTIQEAIDHAAHGSTIVVSSGRYWESLVVKDGVYIYGDPSWPTNVIIGSDEPTVISGERGALFSIKGVTIESYYTGEKRWNAAAILADLGVTPYIRHCIVISYGSADIISANYSSPDIANTTLVGNKDFVGNRETYGIALYNTGPAKLDHLLFVNLQRGVYAEGDPVPVTNSLFWDTNIGDVIPSENIISGESNFVAGSPMYIPYSLSENIQQIIDQGDGNYPGAQMPRESW